MIKNIQTIDENNDQIDLSIILNFFLRNKAFIGFLSLITFITGIFYSLTLPKVWEGQFQIVLKKENQNSSISPLLQSFAGNLTGSNELSTEVEILKSPSVLMPVFEFAKSQNNEDISKGMSFSNWKGKNLDIGLQGKTSVLNISYRNKYKETIIPILKKMSFSYQEYSGNTKKRAQQLANTFLREQISIFKKKSANSLKAAQDYAIDQDLVFYDLGLDLQNNSSRQISSNNSIKAFLSRLSSNNNNLPSSNSILPNIDIENSRVQAANQIRKIDIKLKQINDLNNTKELQYIASSIPELVAEGLPQALSTVDSSLAAAKSKYTNKDIKIQELLKEKNLIINIMKNKAINYLAVQKLDAEATLEATKRPKDVLLKYKELVRESSRDEATLIQLEDRLNLAKLELSRQEDPWKLITKPTLLATPVSPNKKLIGIFSLLVGSFLGSALSFLKEKRSGIIFEVSEIENLIPIELISKINMKKIEYETEKFLLIKDLLNRELDSIVNFISYGNIEFQELDKLKKFLIGENCQKDIKFTSFKEVMKDNSNYLILKLGCINYTDLSILKKRLDLFENNFNGLIVLT